MKKIVAFVLSVSMCLSLLTVLTPAFAYGQNTEQAVQMSMADPDKKPDPEREVIQPQYDNN